jgi:hypothetical protein
MLYRRTRRGHSRRTPDPGRQGGPHPNCAARLYLEAAAQAWGDRPAPSAVPSGVASLLGDRAVRGLAELSNTITHWSQFPTGGHFASLQAPELLVTDIREFFRTVRP